MLLAWYFSKPGSHRTKNEEAENAYDRTFYPDGSPCTSRTSHWRRVSAWREEGNPQLWQQLRSNDPANLSDARKQQIANIVLNNPTVSWDVKMLQEIQIPQGQVGGPQILSGPLGALDSVQTVGGTHVAGAQIVGGMLVGISPDLVLRQAVVQQGEARPVTMSNNPRIPDVIITKSEQRDTILDLSHQERKPTAAGQRLAWAPSHGDKDINNVFYFGPPIDPVPRTSQHTTQATNMGKRKTRDSDGSPYGQYDEGKVPNDMERLLVPTTGTQQKVSSSKTVNPAPFGIVSAIAPNQDDHTRESTETREVLQIMSTNKDLTSQALTQDEIRWILDRQPEPAIRRRSGYAPEVLIESELQALHTQRVLEEGEEAERSERLDSTRDEEQSGAIGVSFYHYW